MLLAPLRSAADLSFYRNPAERSALWLAGYLAYLGLLSAAAGTIAIWLRVAPVLRETIDWAATSVPSLTFSGGKITSAAAGPVRLQHPSVPAFAVMLDTGRGSPVTLEEMQRDKLVAYVTATTLYLLPRPERLEAHDLAKAGGVNAAPVTLDATFYRSVGQALPFVLYPLAFATGWAFFLVWTLMMACVYSLAAAGINAGLGAGLDYACLWKLSLLAQTPAVLIRIAQMFLPTPIPFSWLIGILVTLVYLWQAVRQNARPPEEPQAAEA